MILLGRLVSWRAILVGLMRGSWLVYLLVLAAFPAFLLADETEEIATGQFPITHFSAGPDGPSGNARWLTRDQFGRIYAGGLGGLFQFDGHRWHKLESRRVLYPCFDGADRIYGVVGEEFGYWDVSLRKVETFQSLAKQVAEATKDFKSPPLGSQVRDAALANGEVFFSLTTRAIGFKRQGDEVRVRGWDMPSAMPGQKVRRVRQWLDKTVFQIEDVKSNARIGLAELESDGTLKRLPEIIDQSTGEVIKRHCVDMEELPGDRNEMLLCCLTQVYALDPETYQARVALKEGSPFMGVTISDSVISVGTYYKGVYFLDNNLKIQSHLSQDVLPDVHWEQIADSVGRLWCTSKSGLYRVEHGSQTLTWDHEQIGAPTRLAYIADQLFITTNLGLYTAKINGQTGLPVEPFKKSGGRVSLSDLAYVDDSFFFGGISGVWVNEKTPSAEGARRLTSGFCRSLLPLPKSNRVVALFGDQKAKLLSRVDGEWSVERTLPTEMRQGSGMVVGDTLWVSSSTYGFDNNSMQRVSLDGGDAKSYSFDMSRVVPFRIGSDVYAAGHFEPGEESRKVFHKYSSEQDAFLPTDDFQDLERIFRLSGRSNSVMGVQSLSGGEILVVTDGNYMLRGTRERVDDQWQWRFQREFQSLQSGYGTYGMQDDYSNVWLLAGSRVLCKPACIVQASPSSERQSPSVLLTQIALDDEPVEAFVSAAESAGGPGESLEYSDATLRFRFAVPLVQRPEQVRFAHRMVGQNSRWSEWSSVAEAQFPALREGRYTFEVKALIDNADESEVTQHTFVVLPPWYRTPWLQGLAVAVAAIAIALVVRWRIRIHMEQNRVLREQIAERERAEELLKISQGKLLQKERIRALGEMAAGVAHDVNNALLPIVAYSEQIAEDEQASDSTRELAENIIEGVFDAAEIIRRIQPLYRDTTASRGAVQLDELIIATVETAQSIAESRHADKVIEFECSAAPATIVAARSDIREMLLNLTYNSMDAIEGRGTVSLRCFQEGELAVVEVADNGCGMPADVQRRCMEAFYSTKSESGSGLGLATTQAILTTYGGAIELESELGVGTKFRLLFPTSEQASADLVPLITPQEPRIPTCKILLVEDFDSTRLAIRRQLELLDQNVVDVSSGRDALEALGKEQFDVVMTDYSMRGMNGAEFRRLIPKTQFKGPIVFITTSETPGIREICDALILKPTTTSMLRDCLRNVVGASDSSPSDPGCSDRSSTESIVYSSRSTPNPHSPQPIASPRTPST